MKGRWLGALGILLAGFMAATACRYGRPPLEVIEPHRVYNCPRVNETMIIDGKLDETIWSRAPVTEPFVRFAHDEVQTVAYPTQARMAWDDRFLYVGFRCEDPDVWSLMQIEDELLCKEEVVEIFIDPDGDGRNYVEIEVNPANAHIDLLITRPGKVGHWEKLARWDMQGLRTGVQVEGTLNQRNDEDRGWSCEIAVPLEAFSRVGDRMPMPPNVGDRWRAQLFRFDRPDPADIAKFECTSWSPTDTWHHPANFGTVIFEGAHANDQSGQ